jgi:NitT/TauT family transport system substrate-binding protein
MLRRVSRARALSLALVPASLAAWPRAAGAQTTNVRCATTGATVFAQPYLLADLGYYKRAGLDVVMSQFPGGALTITAVLTGNADIGITTPTQLGSAIAHDLPVRMIGYSNVWDTNARTTSLYVTRDSPLRDAKSLVGKSIGVNALNSTNFLGVAVWLTQNGVDPAQVRTLEVPFAEIAAALKRGTIDAGVLTEPFIAAAHNDIRALSPSVFDSLGTHYAISCWFSRLDFIRANPTTIKRLMDLAYEAAKYINHHHAETNPILSRVSKLPLETIAAIPPLLFAERPDPGGTRFELESAYKYKMFARPLTIEEMTAA